MCINYDLLTVLGVMFRGDMARISDRPSITQLLTQITKSTTH